MYMPNKDTILGTINSFGSVGVKKTDLKKKYSVDNLDSIMDDLLREDKVCMSKKGSFIYCWGKDFFLDYLLNSDLKFKYLYTYITTIQNKINNYSDSIFKYIENLDCELVQIRNSFNNIENKIENIKIQSQNRDVKNTVSLEFFTKNFDSVLMEKSTSIGWVELSSVKAEICDICDISDKEFYNYVSAITELHPEKYELSSGGFEGVILRGIVHGFVRCI
jgi:hypothetical protein